jgi:hypothetical protein
MSSSYVGLSPKFLKLFNHDRHHRILQMHCDSSQKATLSGSLAKAIDVRKVFFEGLAERQSVAERWWVSLKASTAAHTYLAIRCNLARCHRLDKTRFERLKIRPCSLLLRVASASRCRPLGFPKPKYSTLSHERVRLSATGPVQVLFSPWRACWPLRRKNHRSYR